MASKPSEANRVAEAVRQVRFERYRDWSRAELLCHPLEASRLAHAVRLHTQLAWTDRDILWMLFPASERPKKRQ